MKKKLWIVFVAAISTTLLAQDTNTSAPTTPPAQPEAPATTPPPATETPTPAPETPAPAQPAPGIEASTNAPATPAKPKRKKVAKKKATHTHTAVVETKTVPLVSGPAVVSANHVNVRSKAGLVGEIISRMTNGEPVTVIEEVHLKKSGPEEPSAWAKIALPADAHVWLKSSYIDANNTVSAKKLNLRAGPGENFGIVGTLQKGDTVQQITTKGDWTQIQAPANAFAFMAAEYLTQSPEALAAATPATPATVTETNEMAAPPTNEVAMTTGTNEVAMATGTNEMTADTNQLAMDTNQVAMTQETNPPTPPEPRIVAHEGIVRASASIQAPTRFELISVDTHRTINYLYPPTPDLDMSRYKGLHIIVTGEEGLDERWKNTPVITVQKIQVLE